MKGTLQISNTSSGAVSVDVNVVKTIASSFQSAPRRPSDQLLTTGSLPAGASKAILYDQIDEGAIDIKVERPDGVTRYAVEYVDDLPYAKHSLVVGDKAVTFDGRALDVTSQQ